MEQLAAWDSFYVIVGSSAGALIGLQFVVLTLIAERPSMRVAEAGAAFITPTIFHFSVVLLLSVLVRMPWPSMTVLAALWAIIGVLSLIYAAIVARRMRTQTAYKPAAEDYFFYAGLPLSAYAILIVSAVVALNHTHEALFTMAGATLLLMFTAIRNAWDGIAYHVFYVRAKNADEEPPKKSETL